MKVKILRTTVADKRIVRAGSVEELNDRDAGTLIALGKAVAFESGLTIDEPVVELNTDNAEPVIAEEAPRRGRKSRKG